ncbi:MAG: hypothetical protein FJW39_07950 [Acidobacteria bacterium]|nr:hypothetical protein [Acidobacteriota bacterium]
MPVQASVALPITGGTAEGEVKNGSFHGGMIRFDRVYSMVEGDFGDRETAAQFTFGNWNANPSPIAAKIVCQVEGLTYVNRGPLSVRTLSIGSLNLEINSIARSNLPTSFTVATSITGVVLDGVAKLAVTLAPEALKATSDQLAQAYEQDEQFYQRYGHMVIPPVPLAAGGPRMFPKAYGMTAATVVDKIEWAGAPLPGVAIHGNSVVFPDFGVIHFGEVMLSRFTRRISMLRVELGSPDGGDSTAGEGSGGQHEYP